jgi:hypothetical protein
MDVRPSRRRVPQVNLLAPPPQALSVRLPVGWVEIGAVGCGVLIWGTVAFGLGLLLGWHPDLGLGP